MTGKIINHGIPTFFDTDHSTAHNKIMIIDSGTVLTGSYNFVPKAETKNTENLLVLYSKDLSKTYTDYWNEHLKHSLNKTSAEKKLTTH